MLRRLVAFLLGYLRIEVSGSQIARFLNGALEQEIPFWGIERTPNTMRATLTVQGFRALRPVARAARCRVRILERHGLPFLGQRMKRRPVLVTGFLACLLFLLWVSGHIWLVEVKITGPRHLDPRAVAAVAAEVGLQPGMWKSRIDTTRVQAHLQKRIAEVSWAVIRIQGTRVVIEVVEKAAERRAAQPGCIDLIARKSGVIEQVVPFQGESVVRRGDVVRKGDLLVECAFRYYSGGRPSVYPGTPLPPRESTARTVPALAEVKARVTYQEYREVPLFREVPIPTGREAVRWVLNWKEKPILKGGAGGVTFDHQEERSQTYPRLPWRNWKSPVEVLIVHSNEVQVTREPVPLQQALHAARQQMEAQLRWILSPSDRVLSPLQAEIIEQTSEYVGVLLKAETLEGIAEPQAHN